MNLLITKEYVEPSDNNTQCIKCSMLRSNGVHLFIASNQWETIYIELCEELPTEKLRYMSTICPNLRVKKSPDLEKYADVLMELFPSKGGTLRRCKLGGGCVADVIKEYLYE